MENTSPIDYKGRLGTVEANRADGMVTIRLFDGECCTVSPGDIRYCYTIARNEFTTSVFPFLAEGDSYAGHGEITISTHPNLSNYRQVKADIQLGALTPEQWERLNIAVAKAFAIAASLK